MLAEFLLSAREEGGPMLLEAGNPLLTERRLNKLWVGQEEHIV
jgi:hypothetical protein